MIAPSLNTILEYLALLIAERGPDEMFLVRQIQPALRFKFPSFTFAAYGLNDLRDLVMSGERAGYFALVDTGSPQTMYLKPGPRGQATAAPSTLTPEQATRRLSAAFEAMLRAERADHITGAVRDLPPALMVDYLTAQENDANRRDYEVRGKIRRLREFLARYTAQGEAALPSWRPSRPAMRLPLLPPVKDSPRIAGAVWAMMKGDMSPRSLPPESLTAHFFGVMRFLKDTLLRERALDWASGLDMLEAELRPLAQRVPPPRAGRGTKAVQATLDEAAIEAATAAIRHEAGIRSTGEHQAHWMRYAAADSLEACFDFLEQFPELIREDGLLTWLDEQINARVIEGDLNAVRVLANKAVAVIAARRAGPKAAQKDTAALRDIYNGIMAGARLLGAALQFIEAEDGAAYLDAHPETLQNEAFGAALDDQQARAAQDGVVNRFRRIGERRDLWKNVATLGMEQGLRQHTIYLSTPRDNRQILTEIGVSLLQRAGDIDSRRDVLERYPQVVSSEGYALVAQTMDLLSLRQVEPEEYKRCHEARRLIERAMQIGIDRTLAEMK